MERKLNKLTVSFVEDVSKRGMYADGGGLWLQVSKWGNKSWIFRFDIDHKRHKMGLGALHTVSLSEARSRARQARQALLDAHNPLADRAAALEARKLEALRNRSFADCANEYLRTC